MATEESVKATYDESIKDLSNSVQRLAVAMAYPDVSVQVLKMISETMGDSKHALDKLIAFKEKWGV